MTFGVVLLVKGITETCMSLRWTRTGFDMQGVKTHSHKYYLVVKTMEYLKMETRFDAKIAFADN